MNLTKEQLWQAVLGELEVSLGRINFMTWLKQTRISSIEDNDQTVVIGVPNIFTRSWLEKKYHKAILSALQNITDGQIKQVVYKIEVVSPIISKIENGLELEKEISRVKTDTNGYGLNPRYTFENFVVGKGNELAHAACLAVAEYPGEKYNPLFIYGGVGLGKTHLLQAIGRKILNDKKKMKVLYTNMEKFTNEFVTALRTGTIDKFKKAHRDIDVLLVDDVQFMAGKDGIQEEFFHTFNDLHQKNKQIVLTSDRPPKAIPALEERLTSRFEWGMIADITSPDLETRMAILESKAKENNYQLTAEICRYIASQIQSNVRELEGALNKIIVYHRLHKLPLSMESVKDVLTNLIHPTKKGFVQSKQIIQAVADFYGIRVDELIGDSRKRELVHPRQVAVYLMREELDDSFPLIGRELGGRDHTTAMHSYNRVKKEIENNGRIKQEIDLIKQRIYS